MGRQTILTRETPAPPFLVCVMDESVLWREVGSPKVMYDQLTHLANIVSERVIVQVVPSVFHRGNSGAFVLATLADRHEVAYMETGARGITSGDKEDITILNEVFDSLRSQAFPVNQSIDLILRTAEEKWN
jgi:hypothetical protein